jgi:hypothetical protein
MYGQTIGLLGEISPNDAVQGDIMGLVGHLHRLWGHYHIMHRAHVDCTADERSVKGRNEFKAS